MSRFTTNKRARLGPARAAMTTILGDPTDCNNLLQPLHATKGMLFPYTPQLNFGGTANYNQWFDAIRDTDNWHVYCADK
jgi:hypothetical protein